MGTVVEKIDTMERVAELHLKEWKPSEIARDLGITPAQAKFYISEYQEYLKNRVMEDPDFLDRLQENTLESLERFGMLIREAWETYETCKNNDMVNQQINLLKVAAELEDKRAKLLQLMGAKVDSGMTARMQRAEMVNEMVSRIIKDVVSDCEKCKVEVMPRLAAAFAAMNKPEEAADIEPVVDVESSEDEDEGWTEGQQSELFDDVVAYE